MTNGESIVETEQIMPSAANTKEEFKEVIEKVLRHHVWGAIGVGFIPMPLVDLVGLTGIQLHLLQSLAEAYHIPFSHDTLKNMLSSVVSGSLPVVVAPSIVASIAKFIPFLGQTAGVVTLSAIGGAATYALGKVFIQHFASGGTFLTFDPDKVRQYYAEMFQEGKKVVTDMNAKNNIR